MIRFEKANEFHEIYNVYNNDVYIGYFEMQKEDMIHVIYLEPKFRGNGFMSKIYQTIEQTRNITLKPGELILNKKVLEYWKKRNADLSKSEIEISLEG